MCSEQDETKIRHNCNSQRTRGKTTLMHGWKEHFGAMRPSKSLNPCIAVCSQYASMPTNVTLGAVIVVLLKFPCVIFCNIHILQ